MSPKSSAARYAADQVLLYLTRTYGLAGAFKPPASYEAFLLELESLQHPVLPVFNAATQAWQLRTADPSVATDESVRLNLASDYRELDDWLKRKVPNPFHPEPPETETWP